MADAIDNATGGPDDQAIMDLIVPPAPGEEKPPQPPREKPADQQRVDEPEDDAEDTEDLVPGDDDEDDTDVEPPSEDEPAEDDAEPSEDEPPHEDEVDLGPVARWPAEERERFKALPPETQKWIVSRERDREAAFTRRTQALSENQQRLEENVGRTTQMLQHLEARKTAVDTALLQLDQLAEIGALPQKPSIELLDSDPVEYQRREALYNDTVARIQHLQQQREELETDHRNQRTAAEKTIIQREAAKLVEAVPEFADPNPEVRKDFQAGVTTMLVDRYGATPDDIKQIRDHRIMRLAADHFRLLRQIERRQKALKAGKLNAEQGSGSQKTLRATPRKSKAEGTRKKEKVLREKMKTSGNVDDVAAWIGGPSSGR